MQTLSLYYFIDLFSGEESLVNEGPAFREAMTQIRLKERDQDKLRYKGHLWSAIEGHSDIAGRHRQNIL